MTIVLMILKIIGILLLVILGIVLIVLLSVLLVPIRYRICGRMEEQVHILVQLNWLLHLISYRGELENQSYSQRIRICGIPISVFQKKEKKPEKKTKTKRKRSSKRPEEGKPVEVLSQQKEEQKIIEVSSSNTTENKATEIFTIEDTENTGKIHQILEKIRVFLKKIKEFPRMMKEKLEKLKDKLSDIKGIISRVKQEIQNEANRKAVAVVFREVKYLLKHIVPRKMKGKISFGMEDPATTGQIIGIISVLPFAYRYQVHIYPDFETDIFYLKGNLDVKGHIRMIHLVAAVIRLLIDQNIRNFIQRIRN